MVYSYIRIDMICLLPDEIPTGGNTMKYATELRIDDLTAVSGGAASADDAVSRKTQMDKAVRDAGLSLGPHQVESLCDAWEKTGYALSAADFLAEQIAAGKVS